jgi:hypothetical protein
VGTEVLPIFLDDSSDDAKEFVGRLKPSVNELTKPVLSRLVKILLNAGFVHRQKEQFI